MRILFEREMRGDSQQLGLAVMLVHFLFIYLFIYFERGRRGRGVEREGVTVAVKRDKDITSQAEPSRVKK